MLYLVENAGKTHGKNTMKYCTYIYNDKRLLPHFVVSFTQYSFSRSLKFVQLKSIRALSEILVEL